ncbi:MAG TPA: YerC/YecD family TrpR-related protein [Woeseiaceae bacterium]|nr:YerC/YecD family TrpR-related protein [Woeseiaceae bacterium]
MKASERRDPDAEQDAEHRLYAAVMTLQTIDEARDFFRDLCTPAELQAIADRWRVVGLLREKRPYREIHDLTGVSVTTIGRVARFLEFGNGGYRRAVERLEAAEQARRPAQKRRARK